MAAPLTHPLPIGEALARSEPLGLLRDMLRQSNERFAVIAPLLPQALADHVRPGPVAEGQWALLADNAAVAAKLRQLLPRLEAALAATSAQRSAIRIRVQSR
ncbi:MAG TPA: DciA family protein [Methylibium sp.]|nr:DciA family protein [Methylibium sp.]